MSCGCVLDPSSRKASLQGVHVHPHRGLAGEPITCDRNTHGNPGSSRASRWAPCGRFLILVFHGDRRPVHIPRRRRVPGAAGKLAPNGRACWCHCGCRTCSLCFWYVQVAEKLCDNRTGVYAAELATRLTCAKWDFAHGTDELQNAVLGLEPALQHLVLKQIDFITCFVSDWPMPLQQVRHTHLSCSPACPGHPGHTALT